jgi:hypothetical protein
MNKESIDHAVKICANLDVEEINKMLGNTKALSMPMWIGLNAILHVKTKVSAIPTNSYYRYAVTQAQRILN